MTFITIKEYVAAAGSLYSHADAQKIGPVLHELSQQGAVTARDVVDAARGTQSPLHEYFEWDDKIAADKFRLRTAGTLLASIKVRYIENGQPKEARAFQVTRTSVYEGKPREYREFTVLYGDSAFAAQMMDRALEDLVNWRKRYAPYTEMWTRFDDAFIGVINQISEFEEEVTQTGVARTTDDALTKLLAWREEFRAVAQAWTAVREQVQFIMEAIQEAEEAVGRLNQRHKIACLGCGKEFASAGAHNRLCLACRQKGAGLDEIEVQAG